MANLLLVEDNQDVLETLCLVMREAGHPCWTTAKGRTAIALCHSQAFDCLLLDHGLPDLPGTDLAVALALLAVPPPVIMVSGETFHTFDWTVDAGTVRECLRKPVRAAKLLDSVSRAIA